MEKWKLTKIRKIYYSIYVYISCFIIFPWSLIWIHPCLIWIQHSLMIMMMMMMIVIIIILLIVQLLLLLLLLLSSSSSFFCVIECFVVVVVVVFNRCLAVWYPFCFSGQAVYSFTAIKPSSRSSSSFVYLFIYLFFFCHLSFNPFSFYIRFLIRSVAVRFDEVSLPIICS